MYLAADYPLMDIIWTMFVFFAWVIWFWLLITVFSDLFRRHDTSGWGKAAWSLFVIVLPYLGVFVYLISQGKEMAERRRDRGQQGVVRRLRPRRGGQRRGDRPDRQGEGAPGHRRDRRGGVRAA